MSGLEGGTTYWFAIKASDGTNEAMWPGTLEWYSHGVDGSSDWNANYASTAASAPPPPSSSGNLLDNWYFDGAWEGTATSGNPESWIWGKRGERTTAAGEVYVSEASFAHEPYTSKENLKQLGKSLVNETYYLAIYAKGTGKITPGIVHSGGTESDAATELDNADWTRIEFSYESPGSTADGGVDIGLVRKTATGERLIMGAVWFSNVAAPADVADWFDTTPPAAVTDLAADTGASHGAINLTWTAPGGDGTKGNNIAGCYKIRWSETYVQNNDTATWWDTTAAANEKIVDVFKSVGLVESATVDGLTAGTTYCFAVKAYDSSNNESAIDDLALSSTTQAHAYAYTAPSDYVKPSAISNLTVSPNSAAGALTLTWTAPGDDGTIGTAIGYEVRYSQSQITEDNFDLVNSYTQGWSPGAGGSTENHVIDGLLSDTSYYIAIKAYDDNPDDANEGIWPESQYSGAPPLNVARTNANVVINEFLVNPAGTDGGYEWIELYNNQSTPVDISSWTLKFPVSGTSPDWKTVITISSPNFITANGYFLLAQEYYTTITPDQTYANGDTLLNTSGGIALFDDSGNSVDRVVYGVPDPDLVPGAEGDNPAPSGSDSLSISRVPDGKDTNNNGVDFETSPPSPVNSEGPDVTAPSAITDLTAYTGANKGEVYLFWTAPGDDGTTGDNGTAASYEIKYATYPAEEESSVDYWWWKAGGKIETTVYPQGMTDMDIVDLLPGATYYFAIKTTDESENVSDIDTLSAAAATQATAYAKQGTSDLHIVINEVSPKTDQLELYNATSSTQNIKGWSLWAMYSGKKEVISGKEIITFGDWDFPPDTYLVVDFNQDTLTTVPFQQDDHYVAYSNAKGIVASTEEGLMLYSNYPEVTSIVDAMVYTDNDFYYMYPDNKTTQRYIISGLLTVADYADLINNDEWIGYAGTSWENRPYVENTMALARYLKKFTYFNPYVGKFKDTELSGRSLARDSNSTDILNHKKEWAVTEFPSMGSQNQEPDTTAPARITDLAVAQGENSGTIRLSWTAPGDDGTSGTADAYVVRYAETSITVANFNDGSVIDNHILSLIWAPKEAGGAEEYLIGGLAKDRMYYFSIMAEDEAANHPIPSNSPGSTAGDTIGSFVRVNEVAPQETGGNDWLEIYNAHTSAVNLSGWKIYQKSLDLLSGIKIL